MSFSKRGSVNVVAAGPSDLVEVRDMFNEYARWLGVDLSFQGFAQELETLPGAYAPPTGALLIARTGENAAGCVAVRAHAAGECEMKRLWVRPEFRGQGIGRVLVSSILEEARSIGYRDMVLDTLETMTQAVDLYHSFGFRRTGPYYHNPLPGAVYLRKVLS